MTKFILALLALVCLFLASTSAPSASAAPSTDDVPQFGACRWYCGSKSFTTKAACTAVCTNDFCEQIC